MKDIRGALDLPRSIRFLTFAISRSRVIDRSRLSCSNKVIRALIRLSRVVRANAGSHSSLHSGSLLLDPYSIEQPAVIRIPSIPVPVPSSAPAARAPAHKMRNMRFAVPLMPRGNWHGESVIRSKRSSILFCAAVIA